MSTPNATTILLDKTRTSHLQEHADTVVQETADALIQEAERVTEPLVLPRPDQLPAPLTYPEWPTSTPGPQATPSPAGMKPMLGRTDQIVYECYDQERGVPCTAVPKRKPIQDVRQHPLADQVKGGMQVYDVWGSRVGKILVRFSRHFLVERGWIFRRSYYVPLWLVQGVEGQRVGLAVSEATLSERGYATPPSDLYHVPQASGGIVYPDISDASQLGKFPPTPAETGHYHYGPHSPGINTDAGGSYAPHEVDPYGRLRDRPVKLYVTGKGLFPRTL